LRTGTPRCRRSGKLDLRCPHGLPPFISKRDRFRLLRHESPRRQPLRRRARPHRRPTVASIRCGLVPNRPRCRAVSRSAGSTAFVVVPGRPRFRPCRAPLAIVTRGFLVSTATNNTHANDWQHRHPSPRRGRPMARRRHHHPCLGAALTRRQSIERAQGGLRRLRAVARKM
jgi:hypothetical protein